MTIALDGIDSILKERFEQKVKHSRTLEYDVKYNQYFQLSDAASSLVNPKKSGKMHCIKSSLPANWNLAIWTKISRKPYKERLIIAGALIAAEIDRLIYNENKTK